MPLPESARQFLRPLVGVDPVAVAVYRGPRARELAAAADADALAVGEAVVLGTTGPVDTPEALGVLAHELTHVARQRAPRFVPPVVRSHEAAEVGGGTAPGSGGRPTTSRPDAATAVQPARPVREAAAFPVPADEEALARLVEARVAEKARAALAAPVRAAPAPDGGARQVPAGAAAGPALAPPAAGRAGAAPPPAVTPSPSAPAGDWGGLPAPWEPLPAWLTAPSPTAPAAPAPTAAPTRPGPAGGSPRPAPPAGPGQPEAGLAASPIPAPLPVQAATRSRPAADAARPVPAPPPEDSRPDLDLDALARQVYSVLKRRLAAERRRLG